VCEHFDSVMDQQHKLTLTFDAIKNIIEQLKTQSNPSAKKRIEKLYEIVSAENPDKFSILSQIKESAVKQQNADKNILKRNLNKLFSKAPNLQEKSFYETLAKLDLNNLPGGDITRKYNASIEGKTTKEKTTEKKTTPDLSVSPPNFSINNN